MNFVAYSSVPGMEMGLQKEICWSNYEIRANNFKVFTMAQLIIKIHLQLNLLLYAREESKKGGGKWKRGGWTVVRVNELRLLLHCNPFKVNDKKWKRKITFC